MMTKYICILWLLFLPVTVAKSGEMFVEGDFKYTILGEHSVEVSSFKNASSGMASHGKTLSIPSSVVHGGKVYHVKAIGKEAFSMNEDIEELIIAENGVEVIRDKAFAGCTRLSRLVIPEGVEDIKNMVFAHCNNLESVWISSTVESIGEMVFDGCLNLASIEVSKDNDLFDSRDHCNAVIDSNDRLMIGCYRTTIPQGVTTIGREAFWNCVRLEELVVPEGVGAIEADAFYGCVRLKSVSLPMSLKSLDEAAIFGRCVSLESIFIPAGVTSVQSGIFQGCTALKHIVVDAGNKVYNSRMNSNAIVETASDRLVAGCQNTVIVDGVKEIGMIAFKDMELKDIKIPASVTSIDSTAFEGCKSHASISVDKGNTVYDSREDCNAVIESASNTLVLGNIATTIPDGVKKIGHAAFLSAPGVMILPEGVEEIASEAFSGCDRMYSVILPKSLRRIGSHAFSGCANLQVVEFRSSVEDVDEWSFYGTPYKWEIPDGKILINE